MHNLDLRLHVRSICLADFFLSEEEGSEADEIAEINSQRKALNHSIRIETHRFPVHRRKPALTSITDLLPVGITKHQSQRSALRIHSTLGHRFSDEPRITISVLLPGDEQGPRAGQIEEEGCE